MELQRRWLAGNTYVFNNQGYRQVGRHNAANEVSFPFGVMHY